MQEKCEQEMEIEKEIEQQHENISKIFWKGTHWDYERDYPDLAKVQLEFLNTTVFSLLNTNWISVNWRVLKEHMHGKYPRTLGA